MLDQISLSIKLDAVLQDDGGVWVAICPALDVATQAESSNAALSALTEAVEAWFESCLDRNVLDQALRECGFTRIPGADTRDNADRDHDRHRTIECSVPAYALATLDSLHAPS